MTTDHDIADRWALYVANNIVMVRANPDVRIRDAFYAGVYAGLELAGPAAVFECASYIAAAMKQDGTVIVVGAP